MTSTIPTVLDALVSTLSTDARLDGVAIVDGQPAHGLDGPSILVGHGGDDAAIEADRVADLVGSQESYTVVSTVWAWNGSTDLKAVRTQAFDIVAIVDDIVRADPRLGSTVARAHITVMDVGQSQTPEGATVGVRVGIHVDAFVR